MAILQWNNVTAPSLPDVTDAYKNLGEVFDKSLGKLSDGLTDMQQKRKDGATGLLAARASSFTNVDAYNAAMADGSILANIDPSLLDASTYAALDQRRTDLLNVDKIKSGIAADKDQLVSSKFNREHATKMGDHAIDMDGKRLEQDQYKLGQDDQRIADARTHNAGSLANQNRQTDISSRQADNQIRTANQNYDQSEANFNRAQTSLAQQDRIMSHQARINSGYDAYSKDQITRQILETEQDPYVIAAITGGANGVSYSTGASGAGGVIGLITGREGGKGAAGYLAYNQGKAGDSVGKSLDPNITMGQLMERQRLPQGDPNRVFAVGSLQIIPTTLFGDNVDGKGGAYAALGLTPDTKFTPEIQHKMYGYLLDKKQPNVGAYIRGKSDDRTGAITSLGDEFASVADPATGLSRHGSVGNNKASISASQAGGSLDLARTNYKAAIAAGKSEEEAWNSAIGIVAGDEAATVTATREEFTAANNPAAIALERQSNALNNTYAQGALGAQGSTEITDTFVKNSQNTNDFIAVSAALHERLKVTSQSDKVNVNRMLTRMSLEAGDKVSLTVLADIIANESRGHPDSNKTSWMTDWFDSNSLNDGVNYMNEPVIRAATELAANGGASAANALGMATRQENIVAAQASDAAVVAARTAWEAAVKSHEQRGSSGASISDIARYKAEYDKVVGLAKLANERVQESIRTEDTGAMSPVDKVRARQAAATQEAKFSDSIPVSGAPRLAVNAAEALMRRYAAN